MMELGGGVGGPWDTAEVVRKERMRDILIFMYIFTAELQTTEIAQF